MDKLAKFFHSKPHGAYFEQVFKVRIVALQLITKFLPAEVLQCLNLDYQRHYCVLCPSLT